MEITQNIEDAEQSYNSLASRIEEDAHLWGEEQSAELQRRADRLQRLYDAAGTDEFDRIVL